MQRAAWLGLAGATRTAGTVAAGGFGFMTTAFIGGKRCAATAIHVGKTRGLQQNPRGRGTAVRAITWLVIVGHPSAFGERAAGIAKIVIIWHRYFLRSEVVRRAITAHRISACLSTHRVDAWRSRGLTGLGPAGCRWNRPGISWVRRFPA